MTSLANDKKYEKKNIIGDYEFEYFYYKFKLNNTGKKLVVLPGLSGNSLFWSLAFINKYIHHEKLKNYSDIYLFDFSKVNKNAYELNKLAKVIAKDLIDIIKNKLNLNEIHLLGKSFGGGISIILAENEFVKSLNLSCPGHDHEIGFKDFLKSNRKIPIRLISSKEDEKVKIIEIIKMIKQIYEARYLDFDFEIFSNKPYSKTVNHRLQKWNIDNLF